MADDIVQRLRTAWPVSHHSSAHYEGCDERSYLCAIGTLCAEVERLRAEIERLSIDRDDLQDEKAAVRATTVWLPQVDLSGFFGVGPSIKQPWWKRRG